MKASGFSKNNNRLGLGIVLFFSCSKSVCCSCLKIGDKVTKDTAFMFSLNVRNKKNCLV